MGSKDAAYSIMHSLLLRETPTRKSKTVLYSTNREGKIIFSYGPHYPVALHFSDSVEWWVNVAPYLEGNDVSRTTKLHTKGIELALSDAGYVKTTTLWEGKDGHTYQLWMKPEHIQVPNIRNGLGNRPFIRTQTTRR